MANTPKRTRKRLPLQASSYGEEDVEPEGGDAVMSDKVTYTFDELVSQVQVQGVR